MENINDLPLFPDFKPQKKAYIKKDYFKNALDFHHVSSLKSKYKPLLHLKLENQLTLEETLNRQCSWIEELSFYDWEMWIKLFSFIQGASRYLSEKDSSYLQLCEQSPGVFKIKIITNNNFFAHFLKKKRVRDGFDGYTSTDKKKFLSWLYQNQKEFDIIREDSHKEKLYLESIRFYKISIEVGDVNKAKEVGIMINTNIIPQEFVDYLEIPLDIFDQIEAEIEKEKDSEEFVYFNKKDYISNYYEMLLKFYILLKTIYHASNTKETKNGLIVNYQKLSTEKFDLKMGRLKEKIHANLVCRKQIRKDSFETNTEKEFRNYILKFIFKIAVNLKWLWHEPKLEEDNFVFCLNPNLFEFKTTAGKLKAAHG